MPIPEIGLDEDQCERNEHQCGGGPQPAPAPHIARRQEVIKTREHEHDRGLHKFGRLEAYEAQIDPALRALADEADHFDDDQQDQDRDISGERHLLDEIFRDPRHADRDRQEEQDRQRLL